MKWFQEKLHAHFAQMLSMDAILHQGRTEFQDVLIFENGFFGKVLVLDGVVQLTERDNHIYHEMISHVALMAHGAAKHVLIIGGGDGGTLKEVLKHPVEQVTLVELDRGVIELAQHYFPAVSGGAFLDPRSNVLVMDGTRYIEQTQEMFDVIIIDSTDPMGPGELLFTADFYKACRKRLRSGGTIVVQSGAPFFQPGELEMVCERLSGSFAKVRPFLAPVPTYASGMLALVAAGESDDVLCPPFSVLQKRFSFLKGRTRFYTPGVHGASFSLAPTLEPSASSADPSALDSLKTRS